MPKLKILAVLRHMIGLLATAHFVLRAAGLWFIVIVATQILAAVFTQPDAPVSFLMLAATLLCSAAGMVALAGCAVNVHRFILLNEPPAALRLGRVEWRYFLRGLWICLPFLVLGVLFVLALGLGFWSGKLQEPSPLTWITAAIVLGLGALFFFVQFCLSLPAAAIGRGSFTASSGLDASNGNSARLLVLAAIIGLAFWILEQVLTMAVAFLLRDLPGIWTTAFTLPLRSAILILQTIAWAAMLSFAYAGLVERRSDFISVAASPPILGD